MSKRDLGVMLLGVLWLSACSQLPQTEVRTPEGYAELPARGIVMMVSDCDYAHRNADQYACWAEAPEDALAICSYHDRKPCPYFLEQPQAPRASSKG